jgi:superoxide reductase
MAAERLQVFKCEHCGIIVETVHAGGGTLVCCGEPMKLCTEGAVDAAVEKHVPVVKSVDGGCQVSVGSVAHPMEDDHYIEWIEIVVDGKVYRQELSPSDPPQVTFPVPADGVTARAYCNLHGLWKGESPL